MNSKMPLAVTSLLLAGVLAVSYGCASSEESGGGSSGSSSTPGGAGSTGSAGSTGAGGSTGGGSSSAAPASGDIVTFKTGKAEGLFTGYGWVAMGKDDSLTSPTCDTGKPISFAEACSTSTVWKDGGTPHLCMSGTIPPLPASPVKADYDNNWGVQIGVNAAEPPAAIGDALKGYTKVTFTVSGNPATGLRAMLHRRDDPDGTTYCFDGMKTGTAMILTKFNTKCWGESDTVYLKAEDLPTIDKLGVQVSSTSSKIDVQDLCLEKVEFIK